MKIFVAVAIIVCGAVIGGIIGYFGKCSSGQCPLTSTPWGGAIWGALMASALALSLFNRPAAAVADAPGIVKIGDTAQFTSLIKETQQPILVDFYADWCGPCRSLAPEINKLSDEYSGRVTVAKVNIDQQSALAQQYQVSSIPCVIIFYQGKEQTRLVGLNPYQNYTAELEKYLKTEEKK